MKAICRDLREEQEALNTIVSSLSDEQWERRGQHPYFGETTVLTQAINSAIHDLDHIEQIARALGKTTMWA